MLCGPWYIPKIYLMACLDVPLANVYPLPLHLRWSEIWKKDTSCMRFCIFLHCLFQINILEILCSVLHYYNCFRQESTFWLLGTWYICDIRMCLLLDIWLMFMKFHFIVHFILIYPYFFLSDTKRKEEYVLVLYVDWQEWLHWWLPLTGHIWVWALDHFRYVHENLKMIGNGYHNKILGGY